MYKKPRNDLRGLGNIFVIRDYFLTLTVPPLSAHSLADVLIQPWPLQLFCPAQAVVAVPHAGLPLQELMPEHLTAATFSSALAMLVVIPVSNNAAAADASAMPESFFAWFMVYSFRLVCWMLKYADALYLDH